MKIVVNRCFGGFDLSYNGVMEYAKNKGIKLYAFVDGVRGQEGKYIPYDGKNISNPLIVFYSTEPPIDGDYKDGTYFSADDIPRNDVALVKTVETLGEKAFGRFAKLSVVEIPDDVDWEIDEYYGFETIHEKHRTWG